MPELIPATWRLTNLDTGETIESQFTPQEISRSLGAQYAETWTLNRDAPILQWTRGTLETWTFQALFWSKYFGDSLDSTIEFLENLVKRDDELQRPPVCLWSWGNFEIQCVVESLGGVNYVLRAYQVEEIKTVRYQITLKKYDFFDIKTTDPNKRPTSTRYVYAKLNEDYEDLAQKRYQAPIWGDLVRRINPQDPYLVSGTLIALPDASDFIGVEIEPESPPLERTEEGLEARKRIFELRQKDYVSHVL